MPVPSLLLPTSIGNSNTTVETVVQPLGEHYVSFAEINELLSQQDKELLLTLLPQEEEGLPSDTTTILPLFLIEDVRNDQSSLGFLQIESNSEASSSASLYKTSIVDPHDSYAFEGQLENGVDQKAKIPVEIVAPPTRPTSESVTHSIGHQLEPADQVATVVVSSLSHSTEDQKLVVDLHPAELGQVKITINRLGNNVTAQIHATEMATVELLLKDKEILVNSLAVFGFQDDNVEIFPNAEQERDSNGHLGQEAFEFNQVFAMPVPAQLEPIEVSTNLDIIV